MNNNENFPRSAASLMYDVFKLLKDITKDVN